MQGDNEKIARFRQYAEACVLMVEDSRFSDKKTLLREMAEAWIELAEKPEKPPMTHAEARHR